MSKEKTYRAVVEKIISNGKHGPYAVARCEELEGSVTFSLDQKEQEEWPDPGTMVMLSGIRKKRAGWRAVRWRFVEPSDEQSDNQQPKKASERSTK